MVFAATLAACAPALPATSTDRPGAAPSGHAPVALSASGEENALPLGFAERPRVYVETSLGERWTTHEGGPPA
jgi:hypothetical protein